MSHTCPTLVYTCTKNCVPFVLWCFHMLSALGFHRSSCLTVWPEEGITGMNNKDEWTEGMNRGIHAINDPFPDYVHIMSIMSLFAVSLCSFVARNCCIFSWAITRVLPNQRRSGWIRTGFSACSFIRFRSGFLLYICSLLMVPQIIAEIFVGKSREKYI